jgi:phage protein D
MSNGADTRVRESRPTILVAGREVPSLAGGLLRMLIAENISGLYRCEASFGNLGNKDNKIDFLYFDRKTLEFGKEFTIKLGSDTIFDGRIMGLEARFPEAQGPEINVLAEDRFQDLRMTRRTRTFEDVSDSDVISQIASEHGLSPNLNLNGPTHKLLAQINQSDLAFVRERARSIGAEVWMSGSTLNATSRADRSGGTVKIGYGNKLREFTVLADLAGQRTAVAVNGWDVSSKTRLQHEATDSVMSGELNGDASGASVLASAIGARKEALAHTVPLSSREAEAEAEAFFKMTARRFVVGRGVAETDGKLRVGADADLQNLGPLFSGKYYVSEVKHLFDGTRGMRTEFVAERAGLGKTQ